MKKQLELSEKLIFRLQSILEGEDEKHKIERLIFKIGKIKEFSKKSKQELKDHHKNIDQEIDGA